MGTPRYNKVELQALLEYGLTDRLTAIVNPGLQHIDIGRRSAQRGPGSVTPNSARVTLFSGRDLGPVRPGDTAIPGTTDNSNPAAIGYTEVESDVRVLLGHSFKSETPAFFDVQAAERIRTAGAPSEFRFDATLGVQLFPRWLLLAQSLNVVSRVPAAGLRRQL